MPRINRHSVEFTVDNIVYSADFLHDHFDPPSQEVNGLRLLHITNCYISRDDESGIGHGIARCSKAELKHRGYNWRVGIKMAFERALNSMGITPEVDREGWGKWHHAFYSEMRQRATPVPAPVGLSTAVDAEFTSYMDVGADIPGGGAA